MTGGCLVMSLALYPYVYMFARASFAQRSCSLLAAARLLGHTPWGAFLRVALPVARPALAVGGLLVFMETANDIAVAEDFGLPTLGYHVYDLWLNRDELAGAAAVALLMVVMALALASAEAASRKRQRQYQQGVRCYCSDFSYRLVGFKAGLAMAWCALLFLLAFGLPVARLIHKSSYGSLGAWHDALLALADSLFLVALVVILCFIVGALLTYLGWRAKGPLGSGMVRFSLVGYAFPGIIYAMGLILAVGKLAAWLEASWGWSIHWLWVSSTTLLVFALACRFVVMSWGAIEAGNAHVAPSYLAVASNAGKNWLAVLWKVRLPLMRPALLAGALLLLVDVLKELPLTLVLRPFGTTTMALHVYQHASDEDLSNAAPAALLMLAVATVALLLAYRWLVPAWVKPSK